MAQNQSLNLTVILVVALLIIGALGGYYLYQGKSSGSTVTASGNAQLSVPADEVSVYLLIQTKNVSAEGAKNENAEISEKALNALYALGLAKSDVTTENYNIYPEYDYNNSQQKILGYIASNNIKIKTKNFDIVGKIVDSSVSAGALVSNINFELSPEKSNEFKTIALGNATADAKIKAEAIAGGLGKKLGALVSITASDYNYFPRPIYMAESSGGVSAKTAATNIQPGSLDVTASATVVYRVN